MNRSRNKETILLDQGLWGMQTKLICTAKTDLTLAGTHVLPASFYFLGDVTDWSAHSI